MPQINIEQIPIAATKIIVITIKESSMLTSYNNIAYIRVGTNNYPLSLDEVIEKSAESLRVFFDQITTDVPASELNKDLLKEYLERRQKTRGVNSSLDLTDIALSLKIIKKRDTGLFLTNAGILCFTQDPQKHIGNSTVIQWSFTKNSCGDRRIFFEKS